MPTVARIVERLYERPRKRVWLDEEHVWYELGLPAGDAAEFGTDDGLVLERPTERLPRIEELPSIGARGAEQRVAQGGEPWMVFDDDLPLFACWLFRERAPMLAAPGGWLDLPPGAVVLEDSVAAVEARGRGIAPRTWRALAHRLATEGHRALLTKVEVANAPSRRAVTKAGFREVGIMRLRQRGTQTHVAVEVLDPDSYATDLRTALGR